jgi:hypothetical protein
VRWHLIPPFSQIDLHNSWGVDGEPLVGVHDNTKQARIGVDQLSLVSGFQIIEDGSIIEVSQVSHVLHLLELGRVDLAQFS